MKAKIVHNNLPTSLEPSTFYILEKADVIELWVSDDRSIAKRLKLQEGESNSSGNVTYAPPPPTVYRGSFSHANIVAGDNDSEATPRFTLSYMPITGIGILRMDFKVTGNIPVETVIGRLSDNAPSAITLTENQIYVGDYPFSLWVDKNTKVVKCSNLDFSKIGNKRIIFNMIGYFK